MPASSRDIARRSTGRRSASGSRCFVGIKVDRHTDENATAFRTAVTALPEVVSCHLVSGESDFLLQSSFRTSPPMSAC